MPQSKSHVTSLFTEYILSITMFRDFQGSHRLEKYLNIQNCLKKSLKIKYALKSYEFYHLQENSTVFMDT